MIFENRCRHVVRDNTQNMNNDVALEQIGTNFGIGLGDYILRVYLCSKCGSLCMNTIAIRGELKCCNCWTGSKAPSDKCDMCRIK